MDSSFDSTEDTFEHLQTDIGGSQDWVARWRRQKLSDPKSGRIGIQTAVAKCLTTLLAHYYESRVVILGVSHWKKLLIMTPHYYDNDPAVDSEGTYLGDSAGPTRPTLGCPPHVFDQAIAAATLIRGHNTKVVLDCLGVLGDLRKFSDTFIPNVFLSQRKPLRRSFWKNEASDNDDSSSALSESDEDDDEEADEEGDEEDGPTPKDGAAEVAIFFRALVVTQQRDCAHLMLTNFQMDLTDGWDEDNRLMRWARNHHILLDAARNSTPEILQLLLQQGPASIDDVAVGHQGRTPLHAARSSLAVRYLLDRDADCLSENEDTFQPIFFAVARGDLESVKLIVEAALARLKEDGDPTTVEQFLTHPSRDEDSELRSLLHYAGSKAVVDYLVENGVDVDSRGPDEDDSVLEYQVEKKDDDTLKETLPALIKHGVDVNEEAGSNPFLHYIASGGGSAPIMLLLLNAPGVDIGKVDSGGATLLYRAVATPRGLTRTPAGEYHSSEPLWLEVIRVLIAKGAALDERKEFCIF